MKYFKVILIILFSLRLSAQCFPDRHNTTWFDAWESCETAPNPNSLRGDSHWILYDLGYDYSLGIMHLWNINDPENIDDGVKKMVVDYSSDGNTWHEYEALNISQGIGRSIYEGEDIVDFNGLNVRSLLFNIVENYGGDCFGFAELKIGVEPATSTDIVGLDIDCDDVGNATLLEWTYDGDMKNINFVVERSNDGVNWKFLSSLRAKNTMADKNKYYYKDANEDDAFYRITLTDNDDNRLNTSDVVYCTKSNIKLSAYPNPFSDFSKVEVYSLGEGIMYYRLTDILGNKVKEGSINPSSTFTNIDISGDNLANGAYFLEVIQGEHRSQLKMIKI
ncbi:MAG: T9SS type A sorting domain-containing protein [Saprospiraceae bacterium]